MTRRARPQAPPERPGPLTDSSPPSEEHNAFFPPASPESVHSLPSESKPLESLRGHVRARANGLSIRFGRHHGVPNVSGLLLDFSLSGLNELVLARTCSRSRSSSASVFAERPQPQHRLGRTRGLRCLDRPCDVTAKVTHPVFADIDPLINDKRKVLCQTSLLMKSIVRVSWPVTGPVWRGRRVAGSRVWPLA